MMPEYHIINIFYNLSKINDMNHGNTAKPCSNVNVYENCINSANRVHAHLASDITSSFSVQLRLMFILLLLLHIVYTYYIILQALA
jgi:hypothetical protein